MALPALAVVSLAEMKRYMPLSGVALDAELEAAIARASQRLEEFLDRRIVYRAPGEDLENDNILSDAQLANGALTPGAQVDAGGRTLIVTITDANHSITGGTLTVTGTVAGVAGVKEIFDLTAGNVLHGMKFFAGAVTLDVSGLTGNNDANDRVKIGTSQGYVEYHSPYPGSCEIRSLEYPIRGVAEVNEDLLLVFSSSTALVEGTTFTIRERKRIARISNRLDFPWYTGRRVVRVRYSAGYPTAANVPPTIKNVALDLAAWIFKDAQGGRVGLSTVSDAAGNRSFSGPPMLTKGMKDALGAGGYIRGDAFDRTGERDFDLEAA